MRADLATPCSGADWAGRMTLSAIGLGSLTFGPILFVTYCIYRGRSLYKENVAEDPNAKDIESAFSFLLAGLQPRYWWFSCWKMFIKEFVPVVIVFARFGGAPTDPGVTSASGELLVFGLVFGFIHDY